MRLLLIVVGAAVGLGACDSIDDLQQRPIVWTANYSISFDDLANCLVARTASDLSVAPQIFQREKRAIVTLSPKTGSGLVGQFEMRETSPNVTTLDWRATPKLVDRNGAGPREIANRCAKSAA